MIKRDDPMIDPKDERIAALEARVAKLEERLEAYERRADAIGGIDAARAIEVTDDMLAAGLRVIQREFDLEQSPTLLFPDALRAAFLEIYKHLYACKNQECLY